MIGRVNGLAPFSSGANVTTGGSAQHRINLTQAASVSRIATGNVDIVLPLSIVNIVDGQTFAITDGNGVSFTFEINNTGGVQTPVATGNVSVSVDLTSPATDSTTIAQAIKSAIDALVVQKALNVGSPVVTPATTTSGASVRIIANDEDGVVFGAEFNSRSNDTPMTVTSTGAGMLDVWFDWNGDGDFIDAGEQFFTTSQPVVAGANNFLVKVPTTAAIGFTQARFRLSATGGLLPGGLAVGGEVEDYVIEVLGGSPPVTVADTYGSPGQEFFEDNVLNVSAAQGVLANDTDPDGSVLHVFDPNPATPNVEPVDDVDNGTLVLNSDGSFIYTPRLDFFGTDTFVYYASDSRLISNSPNTVTIIVSPVNDQPLAINDVVTILEDTTNTFTGASLTSNDQKHFRPLETNENGQTLKVTNAVIISPVGGSVSVVGGDVVYTPPANYNNAINGPALIRITIEDGGVAGGTANPLTSQSTLTVNITPVNDRPVVVVPTTTNTVEDAGLVTVNGFVISSVPGPANAFDEANAPGTALTFENQQITYNVTPRTTLPGGQSFFAVPPTIDSTGKLVYQLSPDVNRILAAGPTPGFPQILVEVVADDTGLNTGTNLDLSLPVTFTILPDARNDAPEFTIPTKTPAALEDAPVVTVPNFMTNIRRGPVTALDETNQGLSISYVFDPAAFSQAPQIDLVTGTLTYKTAPHINNLTLPSLVVTVTVKDDGGSDAVNFDSTTKSFTVDVTPVNDAPEFTTPATHVTTEDAGAVTQANFLTLRRPGPIAATDEAGQTFTYTVTPRSVQPGGASFFAVAPAIDPSGTLTYTLAPNVNSNSQFGPILVEVFATDSGPGTAPDVNRSAPVTFTILPAPRNDAPEFTIPTKTPAALEDAPVVTVPNFMTSIRRGPVTALDEVNQGLGISYVFDPAAFSQAPQIDLVTGTLTYRTAPHINNLTLPSLVVTVTVKDDGGSDAVNFDSTTKSFTVDVTPVNDAPEFTTPATHSTTEDAGAVTQANFLTLRRPGPVVATDEAGQTFTYTVTPRSVQPGGASFFAVAPAIDPSGTLTYTLAPNVNSNSQFGPILVEVFATDSGPGTAPDVNRSAPVTFTIVPAPLNDAPQYGFLSPSLTVNEDAGPQTFNGFMTGIRKGPATAIDEVTQTLSVSFVNNPPSAFAVPPSIDPITGNLTFTTAPNFNSTTGIVVNVTVSDDGATGGLNFNSTTQSFTIFVNPVNDAPEFTMPATTATKEDLGQVTVNGFITAIRPGAVTSTDESGQSVTFAARAITPAQFAGVAGLPTIDPSGNLVYTLAPDINVVAPFQPILVEVIASDNGPTGGLNVNSSAPVTFTILPSARNDAPEFTLPAPLSALLTANEDEGVVTKTNFLSFVRKGPITALDEAVQTLTATISTVSGSATAFFNSQLPVYDVATNTLTFRTAADVNSATGHDLVLRLTLTDNGTVDAENFNSTTQTFTLTINPINDVPRFTLPTTSISVLEDNEQVNGTTLTQFASFASPLAAGPATAVDETTLLPTRQTLNFVVTNNSNPGLFSVAPRITPAGVLEFATAKDRNGTAVIRVRLDDNGASGGGNVNQSAEQTFTITIQPINDAPEFTLTATTGGLEDQGRTFLPNFATNLRPGPTTAVDEVGQTFTISVVALDPTAFTIQPTISATGTLEYQTGPDINRDSGRDLRVRVFLTDDGIRTPAPNTHISPEQTFTVNPTPVNDAPIFTLTSSDVTVIEDVEQFTGTPISSFPGFATNISKGPPITAVDEFGQLLNFVVVSYSSQELFETAPSIAPDGTLTFKTAQHKNGKSVVIVRLDDNGLGVAPDDNSSDRQTFTISITPVNDAPQFDVPLVYNAQEGQGVVSQNAFAFNVRRGPVGTDDENSQTIRFFATAEDPNAFAIQPQIEVDGTLTFRTKDFVNSLNSNTKVRVFMTDSGANSPAPNTNTSIEKTFSINVAPVNDAPIPDGYTTTSDEDLSVNILASDILVGDVAGPTSDELTQGIFITQVEGTTALGGRVTPVFNGNRIESLVYTPAANAVGQDRFLYVVQDDGVPARSGTGTIVINLTPVNDEPQFSKGPDQVVLEDAGVVTVPTGPRTFLPVLLQQSMNQSIKSLTLWSPLLIQHCLKFSPLSAAMGH